MSSRAARSKPRPLGRSSTRVFRSTSAARASLTIAYDGAPALMLGLDLNHNEFPLDARAGRLIVEAVAKSPFGQAVPDPRFRRAELRLLEAGLDDLTATLGHAIGLAAALGEHELSPLLIELAEDAMVRFQWPTRTADVVGRVSPFAQGYGGRDEEPRHFPVVPLDDDGRASIAPAHAFLVDGLKALKQRFPPHGAVAYVGHAHIDTAWLWPIEETRRKVRRTFSTAVDLLRRNPDFRFAQSFAEYYRHLEDDDPALLDDVRAQVAAGGWAPTGGLWVEPDINMPCGESLVRQGLYGQLYFERAFGRRHTNAWLPDTFGFSAALPQILKGCGLTSLFTIKIGWSETNRFPHTRFWWEGIDGSQVLVQMFNRPEDTYNGLVNPASLLRAWRNHADRRWASEVLQPIGFGDGGGGPTAEMIASQRILDRLPAVAHDPVCGAGAVLRTRQGRGCRHASRDLVRRALSRVPSRRPDQPGPHEAPASQGRAGSGRRRGAGRHRRPARRAAARIARRPLALADDQRVP